MSWGIVESRVLKISPRWRDGNACTTSILRRFLAAAYTQMDAPLWGVKRGHCVFGDLHWLKSSGLGNGSVRENQREDHFVKPKRAG